MALTFIDTNALPKQATGGQGDVTEILNDALCGAQNVHGSLRWLKASETFEPEESDKYQLIYLMDGAGRVALDGQDYDVEKGMGIYLGPSETASIRAADGASLKLFHLVVPHIPE